MPAMPRLQGKPTKIAYAILGKPANMQQDKTKNKENVEKRLLFEETNKVR